MPSRVLGYVRGLGLAPLLLVMGATMTGDRSLSGNNPSQDREMSFSAEATRVEMRGHLRLIAGLAYEDSRKAALRFAASALRMPYDRVRKLYYGLAQRIEAHEADRIRAYVQQAEDLIRAREAYERQRQEFVANARPSLARLAPPPLPPVETQPRVRRRGRG